MTRDREIPHVLTILLWITSILVWVGIAALFVSVALFATYVILQLV